MSDAVVRQLSELVEQARQTFIARDFPRAKALYIKILEKDENNYAALFGMAALAIISKHFDNAILYSRKAINTSPANADAYIIAGHACIGLKDYQNAAKYYLTAIGKGRSPTGCYDEITGYCYSNQLYHGAAETLMSMLRLNPETRQNGAYSKLGDVYNQLGNLQEAKKAFYLAAKNENYAPYSAYCYARVLTYLDDCEGIGTFLQELKDQKAIDVAFFFAAVVYLSAIYPQEDIAKCLDITKELDGISVNPEGLGGCPKVTVDALMIYWHYLSQLIRCHAGQSLPHEGVEEVMYVIGDSHCLSAVYSTVTIDGKVYRCKVKLAAGTQARYFAREDITYLNKCLRAI